MSRLAATFLFGFILSMPAELAAVERQDVERSADQALQDSARFPWYDAHEKQIRPVTLRRHRPPQQAFDWELDLPNRRRRSGDLFWRVVQYLTWGLLVLVFGFGLFLLIRSIGRRYLSGDEAGERYDDDQRTEADRIESLPYQVKRPRADLLGEARRYYQMGNYQDAIIYLFSYQLVKLDEAHLIRLAKGKTNRQYLGEIRRRVRLRRLVTQSMLAFEDVFFGHYTLGKERFEACWNQLEDFHQSLQQES